MSRALPRRAAVLAAAILLVPATALALGPARAAGTVSDLDLADPTLDGASAHVQVIPTPDDTIVTLHVVGIDPGAAGRVLGAHLHVGGCQAGDAAGTGGHYNASGGTVVSPDTEVWLDFRVTSGGTGASMARVPFTIPSGSVGSVVVHANPTSPTGAAGAKLACLAIAP